jgi:hypothetical protein
MFPLQNPNIWNDNIKVISSCPLCQNSNQDIKTRMLGQGCETRLLHLNCNKCGSSLLALVLLSQGAVSSVGMITDLSFEDVHRFRDLDQIDIDDVLGMHQQLKKKDFFLHL